MLVDIIVRNGTVYCASSYPGNFPDADDTYRDVDAPEDCNTMHPDFWSGKYAYDDATNTVYLTGNERPVPPPPPPDPVEELRGLLNALLEGVNGID